MNTPLLTPHDAFNAMLAGKTVLCRFAGDLLDFNDLDQFPATIFAKSGYEFCIKIETIEVAGITFTKPLTVDEIQEGQDIYTVNTHGQSIYISEYGKMTTAALLMSISNGFAQRDAENAKLQLHALSKLFGREITDDILVVRLGEKPKPTRKTRTKIAKDEPAQVIETSAANDVEEIETSSDRLFIKFGDQIQAAQTVPQVTNLQRVFNSNSHILSEHIDTLNELVSERVKIIDPETYDVLKTSQSNIEITEVTGTTATEDNLVDFKGQRKNKASLLKQIESAENIHALNELLPDIRAFGEDGHSLMVAYRKRSEEFKSTDSSDDDQVSDDENQLIELLNDLLSRAAVAQSPAEANALVKYTRTWTEEQRKPLMKAIQKRLLELAPVETELAPSLMRDIENAQDLTTLDALEIDVSARDPFIQKKLMAEIIKRRVYLEPQEIV